MTSPEGAVTRPTWGGHRRWPFAPLSWRVPLLLGALAVLAMTGALIFRDLRQPAVVVRSGMVEVHFTTAVQAAQRDLEGRCELAEVSQMTPVQVRYSFASSREKDVLDCLNRSSIVHAVGLPG